MKYKRNSAGFVNVEARLDALWSVQPHRRNPFWAAAGFGNQEIGGFGSAKGSFLGKFPKREDARQLPLPGTYYEKVYLNSSWPVYKFFNLILLYAKEMKFP